MENENGPNNVAGGGTEKNLPRDWTGKTSEGPPPFTTATFSLMVSCVCNLVFLFVSMVAHPNIVSLRETIPWALRIELSFMSKVDQL